MQTHAPLEDGATARELAELREDLEAVTSHVRMLVEQQEEALRREAALLSAAAAAREQARRREEEHARDVADRERRWDEERAGHRAALAEAADRERSLRDELAALHEQFARHARDTDLLRADRDAMRARLERFRRSLTGRVYAGVRSVGGRVLRLAGRRGAGRAA